MKKKEALDEFGKEIAEARDRAIDTWKRAVLGTSKAPAYKKISKQIAKHDPAAQKLLLDFLPQIVDTAVHHVLWALESDETIEVVKVDSDGDGSRINVKDASDGLSGEIYGDRGWMARFSEEGPTKL